MNKLLCPECETSYQTAATGPRLKRLAQLGCEACGAAGPLRAVVKAVSAPVNGVKFAHGESEEHEASAPLGTRRGHVAHATAEIPL
jgi:hypothetical protein